MMRVTMHNQPGLLKQAAIWHGQEAMRAESVAFGVIDKHAGPARERRGACCGASCDGVAGLIGTQHIEKQPCSITRYGDCLKDLL